MRDWSQSHAFALWLLVVMPACNSLYSGYEGVTDYRKASPDGHVAPDCMVLKHKLGPVAAEDAITAGETISISLTSAFLEDFHEQWEVLNPFEETRGEIAIVAKVTELTAAGMDFNPKSIADKGRVVFYTEDARKHNRLNFCNLPIYGPTIYSGQPLAIQLYVIELDEAEDSKANNLIATLAQAGKSVNSASAPEIALLESLGTALLSTNRDDMEMKYEMVLDPTESSANWRHPSLERGHYVLIRRAISDSNDPWEWDQLAYNQEEGTVVKGPPGKQEDFTDSTYLVVRVDSGMGELAAGTSTTLSTLQHSLNEQAVATGFFGGMSPEDVEQSIIAPYREHVLQGTQSRNLADGLDLVRRYRDLSATPTDQATKAKRLTLLRRIHSLIEGAMPDAANAAKPLTLTADQLQRLVSDLAAIAKPEAMATIAAISPTQPPGDFTAFVESFDVDGPSAQA